jgi:peptide/nickel transport system ATP-binding protein
MSAGGDAAAKVSGLRVRLAGGGARVVDDVSFTIGTGELLGLVGESGSGKTTVALALLGHVRRGLEFEGGHVLTAGTDMLGASPKQLRRLRGAEVAYVPQDPASALSPGLKIRTQLTEGMRAHPDAIADKALGSPQARLDEILDEAGLSEIPHLLDAYPHELSGGQQQRVALAMAFALRPRLIVLDEPTTGLDVSTQKRVLATVQSLCRSYGVAAVYVSHDLAVVGGLVDRLLVLYAGRMMETGRTASVFGTPAHPYTRRLLQAIPSPDRAAVLEGIAGQPPAPGRREPGCVFASRCELAQPACSAGPIPAVSVSTDHLVRCLRTELTVAAGAPAVASPVAVPDVPAGALLSISGLSARYGATEVLSEVSLGVAGNECVAVVGESGSGKTTLARCVVGMHGTWSGEVRLAGEPLARTAAGRPQPALQSVQYIFQNPYTALNPRATIGAIIEQPLRQCHPTMTRAEREDRIGSVLRDVALGTRFWSSYPDQLSGGERQRVAIARALIVSPQLLVCDEITSALDVSVQATIVELLRRLQAEHDLSLLFITHNLALVRSIAQSVVVLSRGRVVESGPVERVFEHPQDPYTVRLMEDVPKLTWQQAPSSWGDRART